MTNNYKHKKHVNKKRRLHLNLNGMMKKILLLMIFHRYYLCLLILPIEIGIVVEIIEIIEIIEMVQIIEINAVHPPPPIEIIIIPFPHPSEEQSWTYKPNLYPK